MKQPRVQWPAWGILRNPSGRRLWSAYFVVGLCAALIVATTAFVLIQIVRIQWLEIYEARRSIVQQGPVVVDAHSTAQVPAFTEPYTLEGMIISLANRNQTLAAFAEFTLVLDCPNHAARQWMEIHRASLRDGVYEATLSFTVEEFSTPQGLARIKRSILAELKARFGPMAPRDLAIRDWTIR